MWWSADTDKGKMRDMNQDSYCCEINDSCCFAVVCDGMGGENGGQVASQMAVEIARKQLLQGFKNKVSENEARRIISCAVSAANIAVYDESIKYPDLKGMGTTMVIAVVTPTMAHIANVGDSRAYILRDDLLTQLTEDHSFVRELMLMGKITEEEAKVHPKRHRITRAVGAMETVCPDILSVDLREDDSILLCSDGLYNYVDDDNELSALAAVSVRKRDVSPLIMRANEKGGGDNITAVIVSLTKGRS